ncbi:hypothetical protein LOC54_06510 [Acetobacter sp. AN02]|uniref:hypothetical protein n=1 Tax=Acetobacter sp. AN02 TaxID=2894186 RepID=UPI002434609F|nr:hypothetical protein [Acetobacter sp. AN02]MDG6094762.1 hypothetical protein [Acetobacter sp. AN02]
MPEKLYMYFPEWSNIPRKNANRTIKYIAETSIKERSYIFLEGNFDRNEKPENRNLSAERLRNITKALTDLGVPDQAIWVKDNFDRVTSKGASSAKASPEFMYVTAFLPDQYRSCRNKDIIEQCFKDQHDSFCTSALGDLEDGK